MHDDRKFGLEQAVPDAQSLFDLQLVPVTRVAHK